MMKSLKSMLKLLGDSFEPFLSASNPNVVKSLTRLGHSPDDIRRIELFDWFQGVGLYGYYEYYKLSKDCDYLNSLLNYYQARIEDGLPAKNINTYAPMLTLISLLDDGLIPATEEGKYWDIVKEWAEWLYKEAHRTECGGFSHVTCEISNDEEMWDDTLFMAVLFLGKAGIVFHKTEYVEEAVFQFLIHNQYLMDPKTGFWFHGYTFEGHHNFVNARWARGNSWVTIFVPLFLEICQNYPLSQSNLRLLEESWRRQVHGLLQTQKPDGLWPTLLDDPSSYSEASASAGFLWGINKGYSMGLIQYSHKLEQVMTNSISGLVYNINEAGVLEQVSGGTAMGKESLDFYREIPLIAKPYGQAMAMMALIETAKRIGEDVI